MKVDHVHAAANTAVQQPKPVAQQPTNVAENNKRAQQAQPQPVPKNNQPNAAGELNITA
jgi:hypothetical protein